jgi:carboxybiotin decarboxylase
MEVFEKLYRMTALGDLIHSPATLIMLFVGFLLLYLGIKKHYEPLLLVPIAFGVLLANFPGGNMAVITAGENDPILHKTIVEIAKDHGIMNMLYYALIKTGLLPPLIFMGVGAMTDFGPMLRNLRLAFFGAAAQLGIFTVLIGAILIGFTPKEAGALGIIGGADGPTAIYTSIMLAPHLLGPIAIAAYSYMALVPVIIPLVVRFTVTKKELRINMKEQEKLYPNRVEIKDMRTVKLSVSHSFRHGNIHTRSIRYAPGRITLVREPDQGNRQRHQPLVHCGLRYHNEHSDHFSGPDSGRDHDR